MENGLLAGARMLCIGFTSPGIAFQRPSFRLKDRAKN
jgi:hypothetical protein